MGSDQPKANRTVRLWLLFCLGLACLLGVPCRNAALAESQLPRRPFIGVRLEAKGNAVTIAHIFPESSASQSNLKVGDVVLAIDGTKVAAVSDFLGEMKRHRTGDHVKCRVVREKKETAVDLELREFPREKPADLDIVYDSVTAKDATLRSILAKPKTAGTGGKLPAVLYIQGIGSESIDSPFDVPDPTRQLVYEFARAGFAVMRCEKSGVGDSTGKPCAELGLHEEVADFIAAVKKLKSYDFVDGRKIFLFGHSAGGWVAPLVASQEAVQGIIAYGTVVRPFAEYLVENRRRNERVRYKRDPADLEEEIRRLARFLNHVLVEKRELAAVLQEHPELTAAAKVVFPEKGTLAYNVRSLRYFREVNDQSMARVWANLDVPVLALVGEFELRTAAFDHEYLAEVVNAHHPGKGTWKLIPKMDHGFTLHSSLQESARNEFRGPFGDQVVMESIGWMRKVLDGT